MRKVNVGVDPGVNGGMVIMREGREPELFSFSTTDMKDAVLAITPDDLASGCLCVLEEVGGYVGVGQPGSTMFTFGHAAGRILGLLEMHGVPIRYCRPQEWQKGIPGVGDSRREAKQHALLNGDSPKVASRKAKDAGKKELCAEAKRRFPRLKVTLKNCDALLLADFARTLP